MSCESFKDGSSLCMQSYGCDKDHLAVSFDGAIFSPYVSITFGGKTVTVGNQSTTFGTPKNHATITSFQYGFGPGTVGWGAEFEITDHSGVMILEVIKAMNKTVTEAPADVAATTFDFGWVIKECNGNVYMRSALRYGYKLNGTITDVEQSYLGGSSKVKFKVQTIVAKIPDIRHDKVEGDDAQKITLKQALRKLFLETHPKFPSLKFLASDGLAELEFKDGGKDGPSNTYQHHQQHPLATARSWLEDVTTREGNGVNIVYDPKTMGLVIHEDPLRGKNCCDRNLGKLLPQRGTFIVNGGNCSPVLEFNPTVNWAVPLIPGSGAVPGGASSGGNKDNIEAGPGKQKAGIQSSPTIKSSANNFRIPDNQAEEGAKAFSAHLEANKHYEQPIAGFTAELKIQGDPIFVSPLEMIGRTIAVIVINPFHLNDQCVWIVEPTCNEILSNKEYLVIGVSHQITNGSFTTSLKLMMQAPNKDKEAASSLGCGGITFTDTPGKSLDTDSRD